MASKTVVELFDDLDGGRADETVRFALDGVEYEIDLSTKHAAKLRDMLAVYIGHAHRPAGRARRVVAEDNRARNGRSGPNGKVAATSSADLTAEIRRLASESAQKASQASRVVVVTEDDVDDTDVMPLLPVATAAGQTTVGPVPALIIPFMEAGL
ncbi:MAG TPA: Lsr2 family protein [Pseudonocardiaceae bacterium]